MSIEVSTTINLSVPAQNSKELPNITRKSARYTPSIWGDRFLSCAPHLKRNNNANDTDKEEHQKLKNELKELLMGEFDKPLEKLELIDAIQRLGTSYHFEQEVDRELQRMHLTNHDGDNDEDLYTISLKFCLLRRNGYNMSCDGFNKFKDSEGKWNESLVDDVKGLLKLYDATQLRTHGEDILDEALAFTTNYLKSTMARDVLESSSVAAQINEALKQPFHKGIPRVEARHYMPFYQQNPCHNEAVLTFAKLDFNMLQRLHQEELAEIAKWWKELDFSTKLPFARNRVIECYFWTLGVCFEPEYRFARRILTKVISMTSVIDDIYDVYGTFEELVLFTKAVERWDISEKDHLPEYMGICYQALLDVFEEIEEKMTEMGKLYRFHYAKEAMKNQVKGYFCEAEWLHNNYVPIMEEYMPIALLTCGYPMLSTISFVAMGEVATDDVFVWLFSNPKMVTASTIVCRLMDDIVTHKFEQERGQVASAVECYMKQHGGSEEDAVAELRKQIEDAWKDMNEECLYPVQVPMPLLTRILNLARFMDVLYKNEDGYTHADGMTKELVASLLIHPVPLN